MLSVFVCKSTVFNCGHWRQWGLPGCPGRVFGGYLNIKRFSFTPYRMLHTDLTCCQHLTVHKSADGGSLQFVLVYADVSNNCCKWFIFLISVPFTSKIHAFYFRFWMFCISVYKAFGVRCQSEPLNIFCKPMRSGLVFHQGGEWFE